VAKFSTAHSQAGTSGELNSMASAGIVASASQVDNTTNLDPWGQSRGRSRSFSPTISDTNTLDVYGQPAWTARRTSRS
jgi:hypothetical protein